MKPYQRWQTAAINHGLNTRRVVILAGARQCGKTTLSKMLVTPHSEYRTLDDHTLLEAAIADPNEFVKHNNYFMIIDEIQKAPVLLPAIKKVVDEDNRPGQYLLTGSANIQSLPGVTESLAGRIRKIPLRPLAQGEFLSYPPTFLKNAFSLSFVQASLMILERDDILKIAIRGGYPEAIKLSNRDRSLWHQDYIEALLERDLLDIINIKRQDAMKNLIHVVAAWSTKRIDLSSIGAGLAISRPTLESYMNALEALFLIDRIPPWTKTDYQRVGKQPRLIMNDSGLMASILKWRLENIRFDGDSAGKLIETHVGNELQKQMDAATEEYTLYHYRDNEKREIDFIVERDDGCLLGLEVKASTSVKMDDFKHLIWFKKQCVTHFVGIVLYPGQHILSFGQDLLAVPISALYN